MNVLRAIRRVSALISTAGWLATIAATLGSLLGSGGKQAGRTLAAEIFFGAIAATSTLVYVIALMTDHFDDTQWSVGYTERLIRREQSSGSQVPVAVPEER